MAQFMNVNVPIANATPQGEYDWCRVKCGARGSSMNGCKIQAYALYTVGDNTSLTTLSDSAAGPIVFGPGAGVMERRASIGSPYDNSTAVLGPLVGEGVVRNTSSESQTVDITAYMVMETAAVDPLIDGVRYTVYLGYTPAGGPVQLIAQVNVDFKTATTYPFSWDYSGLVMAPGSDVQLLVQYTGTPPVAPDDKLLFSHLSLTVKDSSLRDGVVVV